VNQISCASHIQNCDVQRRDVTSPPGLLRLRVATQIVLWDLFAVLLRLGLGFKAKIFCLGLSLHLELKA